MITNRTQKDIILDHLESGSVITPLHAYAEYGIYRLSDVIFRLRNLGYNIITHNRQSKFTGRKYAEYSLAS